MPLLLAQPGNGVRLIFSLLMNKRNGKPKESHLALPVIFYGESG